MRTVPYFVTLVAALAAVEILLRLGIVSNLYYEHAHRARLDGAREAAQQKVLLLGDSFIDNVHCRNCVYQHLLRDLAPLDAAVLNAAESGMGPAEYLATLRAVAPRFRPDLVLLFYYVGNDLTNVQYREAEGPGAGLKSRLKPFLDQFYLYHYLRQKWETFSRYTVNYEKVEKSGVPPEVVALAKRGDLNHWYFRMSEAHPDYVKDNVLMETEENLRAWEKTRRILDEIDQATRALGARLALVIFPHTTQVNRSHLDFFRNLRFNVDERLTGSTKPQDLLKEFCSERGLPCLDLLPAFRSAGGQEFYYESDEHFNARGNRFAENRVFRFLLEHGLVRKV